MRIIPTFVEIIVIQCVVVVMAILIALLPTSFGVLVVFNGFVIIGCGREVSKWSCFIDFLCVDNGFKVGCLLLILSLFVDVLFGFIRCCEVRRSYKLYV